jgi:hypothetical protein
MYNFNIAVRHNWVFVGGQRNMKNRLALLPVVGALLIIATPAFAGIAQTPEPSTVFLIGGGLGALILFDRYRRSKKK